jgi:hypothetical protein
MEIDTEGRHQLFWQRDKVDTCGFALGVALFVADVGSVGGSVNVSLID